jgi:hypothetical protein
MVVAPTDDFVRSGLVMTIQDFDGIPLVAT